MEFLSLKQISGFSGIGTDTSPGISIVTGVEYSTCARKICVDTTTLILAVYVCI